MIRRLLARALLGFLVLIAGYLAAALVLGLLPNQRDYAPPASGVPVYLDSNGVHISLVMPVSAAGVDWRARFPVQHIARPDRFGASPYVAVGWGSRTFFLETQHWSDLTPGKALAALAHDEAVLHVEYQPQPTVGKDTRRLLLSPEQYHRLAAYIESSVQQTPAGQAQWLSAYRYDANDAFYAAQGHYSPLTTCNQWVRDALAAAGVRTALWSPFAQALFWHA